MKRSMAAALLCLLILGAGALTARAAPLTVDGQAVSCGTALRGSVNYIPLRAFCEAAAPEAEVMWDGGYARVEGEGISVSARPGDCFLTANGRALYVPDGIWAEDGAVWVPVRVISKALGAGVFWDSATGAVAVQCVGLPIEYADTYYDDGALYWLSRIISAESRGEPLAGKIAVGNVVLGRVRSNEFPDTIYDVIFDSRWGGQFEPVRNKTIYDEPTAESVLAAKLCLDGAAEAAGCLYFLDPAKAQNFWIIENRVHAITIGCHWFYR